jgi:hypothetical protein
MSDEAFLRALEDGSLPEAAFRHRDHLRAAYLYLRRDGYLAGSAAIVRALAAYARAKGKPERYHETVTLAFMTLVNERLSLAGDGGGFEGFLALHSDLADPGILTRFYRPETLASERARRVFVLEELA